MVNPEIRKAVDSLYEMSADEKVRAEYEMRLKAWRDRESQKDDYYQEGIMEGIRKGRLEGITEGIQKGISEGREEALLETARKLMAMGLSMDQITAATGLSAESVGRL